MDGKERVKQLKTYEIFLKSDILQFPIQPQTNFCLVFTYLHKLYRF